MNGSDLKPKNKLLNPKKPRKKNLKLKKPPNLLKKLKKKKKKKMINPWKLKKSML